MYNQSIRKNNQNGYYNERGFFIPFAIGGLAGTALGYGLSNNNYNNNYYPRPYPYPTYIVRPYPIPYYPYY